MEFFACFWLVAIIFMNFISFSPICFQQQCLKLESPKPSCSPPPSNPITPPPSNPIPPPPPPPPPPSNPITPPPPPPTPSPQDNQILQDAWVNILIVLLQFPTLFYMTRILRIALVFLSFKLFFGSIFHLLFGFFEEEALHFLRFVGIAGFVIILLKLLQEEDGTGISEELGNCFLEFGVDYIIQFRLKAKCRFLYCLVPFGLSAMAMFSRSVQNQFYTSVELRGVPPEEQRQIEADEELAIIIENFQSRFHQ